MPTTSATYPGSTSGDFLSKTGVTAAWSNHANISASDSSVASVSASGPGDGDSAKAVGGTNFGFSIPGGATIDGIKVEIRCRVVTDSGLAFDPAWTSDLVLTKNGTASTGTPAAGDSPTIPSTMTTITYGGATELHGTTWSVSEINASTFGAGLWPAYSQSGGSADYTIEVDFVRITIYYTGGASTPTDTHMALVA